MIASTVGPDDVRAAAQRIAGAAHVTPVQQCQALDRLAGRSLFFKCEHLQKVGAFKFRGAYNAISQLTSEQAARGVVTHSSGNHAQAISLAARMHGIPAYVVMPENANPTKRQAVVEYGGQVTACQPTLQARESEAARIQQQHGAVFIPPFDHPHVIAGQGTAALELIRQVENLDAIIAPVGGGGLISGTCAAVLDRQPSIRVFAAEPRQVDDAFRSKQAGEWIAQNNSTSIADGLLTSLGHLTWPFVRDHVEQVVTVSEEEIVRVMRLCWQRAKLLIEPSSAVAVAAVLSESFQQHTDIKRLGIILSGGNVDLDQLPW